MSRVNTTWEPVSALRYHESCVDELLPGLEDITLLSGEGVVYLSILEESKGLSFLYHNRGSCDQNLALSRRITRLNALSLDLSSCQQHGIYLGRGSR